MFVDTDVFRSNRAHLLGDRHEAVAEDLEANRIRP